MYFQKHLSELLQIRKKYGLVTSILFWRRIDGVVEDTPENIEIDELIGGGAGNAATKDVTPAEN